MVIPSGVLAFGRPAKVIRPLAEEEIANNKRNAEHYIQLAQQHRLGKFPKQEA